MSDLPTRPEPPEKPTWLRKATSEQNVAKSATEKKSVAKKSSRDVLKSLANVPAFFLSLKVDDLVDRGSMTWKERWLHEWRTNRDGVLTSMGLHALLFMLLALWALPGGGTGRPTILDGGWMAPDSLAAKEAQAQPVKIENMQLSPVATNTKLSDVPTKPVDTKAIERKTVPGSGPAQPVAVGGGTLAARTGDSRAAIWRSLSPDAKAERGIGAGLGWLARQQNKGGNWSLHEGYPDAGERTIRTDTGATALALLCFLGDGHTPQEGNHAKVVAKGVAWLKSIQKSDGDFHDHAELGRQTAFYAHSQATIAMCEAYALTGDPSLKSACERAVQFLMKSQHPRDGGWRYQPQTGESMGDLSVTGWALMALHTARMAKLDVPLDNFERATLFLDSVSEQAGSRYKYQPVDPLEKVSSAMTAEGMLCRQWLGWPKDHAAQVNAVEYLLSDVNRPTWKPLQRNVYSWYYTAQVLHNLGGPKWEEWYQYTSQLLLQYQLTGGGETGGSWHPKKPPGSPEEYADKAGRLYLTALCLLVLETPVRHAAVYSH